MSAPTEHSFDPFADPEPEAQQGDAVSGAGGHAGYLGDGSTHADLVEQPVEPAHAEGVGEPPTLRRLAPFPSRDAADAAEADAISLPVPAASPFEPVRPSAPASSSATPPRMSGTTGAGLTGVPTAALARAKSVLKSRPARKATPAGQGAPAMPAWANSALANPSTAGSGSDSGAGSTRRTIRAFAGHPVVRFVVWVLVALAFAAVVRSVALEPFKVPSGSMQGTLEPGDRMLVEKLSYLGGPPRRGDVIVFDGTGSFDPSGTAGKLYVKRVIGVAGDVVSCCDERGRVLVNGSPQWEPYVFEDDRYPFGKVTVPPGHVWVMGDHRRISGDSRFFGPVPVDHVVGRAVVKVWPLGRVGTLPRS